MSAPRLVAEGEPTLRSGAYDRLRQELMLGRHAPGASMSTRTMAQALGVSQMPVRDALSRLAAEGAVEIRSKRRIVVAPMTPARLDEIVGLRLLLEPEAAARALPFVDAAMLRTLRAADTRMDTAERAGDVEGYIAANLDFHFGLYGAGGETLLTRLIETLWVQFGPIMRVVYGRLGTASLVDQHVNALEAIARRDAVALRAAVAADIEDARALIADRAAALAA